MRRYITLYCLLLFSIQLKAQLSDISALLDSVIKSEAGKKNFSGSVLVIEDGAIILSTSVGFANKNNNIKNDLNTKFNIASVGKLFTKIVILQLVEEGRIKLTDTIGRFFPGFEASPANQITVADLLNHRAGLRDVYNSGEYRKLVKSNEPEFQEKVVSVISKEKLKFTPGTKTAYSNSGYYLLGAIASKVEEISFEAVITDRIFNPLGMHNSGFAKTGDIIHGHAIPYKLKNGRIYEIKLVLAGDRPSGAGSQFSTAPDIAKVYLSILYDNVLLQDNSKGLLFNNSEPANWADIKKSGKIVGFVGGDTRGWSAKATFYFLEGISYGVILVANFDNVAHELDLKLRPIIISDGQEEDSDNRQTQAINYKKIFNDCKVDGSVTIYDYQNQKWNFSDTTDAHIGTLPASTFKIINTLIALETGVIADENELIKWPGSTDTLKYGFRPDIYHDMSMKEAFKVSAGWAYTELAKNIGKERYDDYLTAISYGNVDLSADDADFWNFGNLAITPVNQIEILVGVYEETLPFRKEALRILKDIMIEEKTEHTIRAKTGWTRDGGKDIGWWVGYVERKDNVYFFATRLIKDRSVLSPDFGMCRKKITREVLKELDFIE